MLMTWEDVGGAVGSFLEPGVAEFIGHLGPPLIRGVSVDHRALDVHMAEPVLHVLDMESLVE
jgi:hypothetical protein